MVVNTTNKGGHVLTKNFRVFTNDPNQQTTRLVVTGKVEAYVEVSPNRVRIVGNVGDKASQEVHITPQNGHLFTIKEIKANRGDNIRLDLKPLGKEPPEKGYLLTVISTRKEKGRFGDLIIVKTNLSGKSTINIPVSGQIFDKPMPAAGGQKSAK